MTEKVTQEDLLKQFQERYNTLIAENNKLSEQIKQNEIQALKLQGAIETLNYYIQEPPESPDVTEGVEAE